MIVSKLFDGAFKMIMRLNYTWFFVIYVLVVTVINFLINYSLDFIPNRFYIDEVVMRLAYGLPLIFQLFLTYAIYLKSSRNLIMKISLAILTLYTLVCGILSLYDLFYTIPNDPEDLFFAVIGVQELFQLILLILILILTLFKVVFLEALLRSLLIFVVSIILILANLRIPSIVGFYLTSYITIAYNPIFLYLLSALAKEKLFKQKL